MAAGKPGTDRSLFPGPDNAHVASARGSAVEDRRPPRDSAVGGWVRACVAYGRSSTPAAGIGGENDATRFDTVPNSRLCGCICELSRRLAIRHLAYTVKVSSLDGLALFFSRRPHQWRFYAGAVGGVAQAPKLWLGPPNLAALLTHYICSIDSQKKNRKFDVI